MITDILHGVGALLVLVGAFFCVVGGIGVVRLPDFYARCHGSGLTDSAGAGALLLGLMFFAEPLVAVKLLLLVAFLWLSSTVSTHSLAKAAYAQGVRLVNVPRKDWTIPPPAPEQVERITRALEAAPEESSPEERAPEEAAPEEPR